MDNKKSNKFIYTDKIKTEIYKEEPSKYNAYISKKNYIYGYDNLELVNKSSFLEVLLLLFTSELPSKEKLPLFEKLAIGIMHLGIRHPSVRASMTAGVSKANVEHLLPIGQLVLGGKTNGSLEVKESMEFLINNIDKCPVKVAQELIKNNNKSKIVAGFGRTYDSIDEYTVSLAKEISPEDLSNYHYFSWALKFIKELEKSGFSWLKTGLCAVVFLELNICKIKAISLFQIICSAGIASQGLEQSFNRITDMPFMTDEQYFYNDKNLGDLHE